LFYCGTISIFSCPAQNIEYTLDYTACDYTNIKMIFTQTLWLWLWIGEVFFYNEVEYILREELREPRNYFVILKAIAQGKRKISEIINDTGFEKSLVSKYIDTLRGLRFVEKDIPAIVMTLIKDSFEHHISTVYEDICKDLCKTLMADGLIRYSTIDKWWSRNEEMDVVALDEETKTACYAECKWSNKKVGEDIYRELLRKSHLVDWFNDVRSTGFCCSAKAYSHRG
jgi:uncharacterized protein